MIFRPVPAFRRLLCSTCSRSIGSRNSTWDQYYQTFLAVTDCTINYTGSFSSTISCMWCGVCITEGFKHWATAFLYLVVEHILYVRSTAIDMQLVSMGLRYELELIHQDPMSQINLEEMLCWNKAFWLVVASDTTNFNKSKCFISEYNSFAKFLYDICSWSKILTIQTLLQPPIKSHLPRYVAYSDSYKKSF